MDPYWTTAAGHVPTGEYEVAGYDDFVAARALRKYCASYIAVPGNTCGPISRSHLPKGLSIWAGGDASTDGFPPRALLENLGNTEDSQVARAKCQVSIEVRK